MISGTLRPAQRVQGIVSPWLQWFEIISVGFLLDGGETRDTVERSGLYFEPRIGNLLATAGADAVRMCLEGRKRLFNPAKLFDGEYLHRQRDTDLMLSGSLVYRVGEKFWFRNHRLWRQSFLCEYRSKSSEFVLKSSVISALPLLNA
jgi:hypothetical protein